MFTMLVNIVNDRSNSCTRQALLRLLLKISESVIRLESLLHISSPDQDAEGSPEIGGPKFLEYLSHSDESSQDKLTHSTSGC